MSTTFNWKQPTQPYPIYNKIKPLSNIKSYKYLYTLLILIIIFIIVKFI
jgi:hypothetical protein